MARVDDLTDWLRGSALEIVLFVTGAILLSRLARWISGRIYQRIDARPAGTEQIADEAAKHRHVVTQGLTWVVIVLIYSVAAVLVVSRLGIPITGLVAPAAVLGVALGFGAQRIVQDILAGTFIIFERQYGFGDVIRIGTLGSEAGVTGTVEEVTLRITRLRTLQGEVVIVPNGQIVQVINMSRDWARAVVDVPVPATVDLTHAREILTEVTAAAVEDPDLGQMLLDAPTVLGVQSLEVDSVHLRIVARTLPGKQFDVGRELRSRVAIAFQHEGIRVPATVDTAEPMAAS
ncbi:mechanosensitive ion channel family protein [Asanoa siamensis]|nr:mechanosensitive ion channel family protein [Asanoa siamensis]